MRDHGHEASALRGVSVNFPAEADRHLPNPGRMKG